MRVSLPGADDEGRQRQGAVGLVERDGIVAGAAVRGDQCSVVDGRSASDDRHLAVVVVDEDRASGVAADSDGVVELVAEDDQPWPQDDGGDGRNGPSLQRLQAEEAARVAIPPRPSLAVLPIHERVNQLAL